MQYNVCYGKQRQNGLQCLYIKEYFLSPCISAEAQIHQVKGNLAKTSQQLIPAVFTNTWGKPVGGSRIQVCWLGMACIPFLSVYPLVGLPAFDLLTNGLPPPSFSFSPFLLSGVSQVLQGWKVEMVNVHVKSSVQVPFITVTLTRTKKSSKWWGFFFLFF